MKIRPRDFVANPAATRKQSEELKVHKSARIETTGEPHNQPMHRIAYLPQ